MFKDVSNITRYARDYTPTRYNTNSSYATKEADILTNQNRIQTNIDLDKLKRMKTYRTRHDSVNFKSNTPSYDVEASNFGIR